MSHWPHRQHRQPWRRLRLAGALGAAALAAACGGGGLELALGGSGGGVSSATAATAAANGTLIASDAAAALDEALIVSQEVALQAPGATAVLAAPSAVVDVLIDCAASGTALVSISGGTATSTSNGRFDATEVYRIVFTNCRGTSNGAAVSGTLTFTVLTASGSASSLSITASNVVVALPRGSVTLNGDCTRQTTATTGGGSVQYSSRFGAPRLTASTQLNGRSNQFTLIGLDLTRNSTWTNGVLQTSTVTGTHTLAATLLGVPFTHSVSTDGGVVYSATGLPLAGRWVLNVAAARLVVSVLNAVATVTVDDGSNGSVDSTYTFPVSRLQTDAG